MALPDETEFTAFVQRRSRFVFRVAYGILRNPQDAEDVVQETFLKLYRNGAWRHIEDERAFLARTTWRIAIDRLPKRRMSPSGDEKERLCPAPNPEQAAIYRDWTGKIHQLMDSLPEDLRQPLALSTIDDLSSNEIAKILGIAEGTVRTRIMRARSLLREKFAAIREGRDAARLH